jgi:hypothetical protein
MGATEPDGKARTRSGTGLNDTRVSSVAFVPEYSTLPYHDLLEKKCESNISDSEDSPSINKFLSSEAEMRRRRRADHEWNA